MNLLLYGLFFSSKKYELINKKFPNKVGLIYGSMDKNEKEKILSKFLTKNLSILVSTTVIGSWHRFSKR